MKAIPNETVNSAILFEEIKRIKSIADLGLLYCNNEYDRERYLDLQETSFRLMEKLTGQTIETIKNFYAPVSEYPTAKVDIRGFALSDDHKILLVKERSDEKWSLPGGWADIGYSPTEIIIKEFKEETGLEVTAETLLAVFDKKMHPHPPQNFYVYKMVFLCSCSGGEIMPASDVQDVAYFAIDALPELSEDRILRSQLETLYRRITDGADAALFD